MIGYVPQEGILLSDSVQRNVTPGDASLSDADVKPRGRTLAASAEVMA
jgi:ABC-type multidrug transport system fused ATPase/permease subunit